LCWPMPFSSFCRCLRPFGKWGLAHDSEGASECAALRDACDELSAELVGARHSQDVLRNKVGALESEVSFVTGEKEKALAELSELKESASRDHTLRTSADVSSQRLPEPMREADLDDAQLEPDALTQLQTKTSRLDDAQRACDRLETQLRSSQNRESEARLQRDNFQAELRVRTRQLEDRLRECLELKTQRDEAQSNLSELSVLCEQHFAECCVCMEPRPPACLLPCGHKHVCNVCAERLPNSTCPVCREPINEIRAESDELKARQLGDAQQECRAMTTQLQTKTRELDEARMQRENCQAQLQAKIRQVEDIQRKRTALVRELQSSKNHETTICMQRDSFQAQLKSKTLELDDAQRESRLLKAQLRSDTNRWQRELANKQHDDFQSQLEANATQLDDARQDHSDLHTRPQGQALQTDMARVPIESASMSQDASSETHHCIGNRSFRESASLPEDVELAGGNETLGGGKSFGRGAAKDFAACKGSRQGKSAGSGKGKGKICFQFRDHGSCTYGDKCRYRHVGRIGPRWQW